MVCMLSVQRRWVFGEILIRLRFTESWFDCFSVVFNSRTTSEIYTSIFVGSVRGVEETEKYQSMWSREKKKGSERHIIAVEQIRATRIAKDRLNFLAAMPGDGAGLWRSITSEAFSKGRAVGCLNLDRITAFEFTGDIRDTSRQQ